ncbi:MAG: hypothetical protein QFC78_09905 [Pseudomonadota bacterium]|nr:hypothetical protein [Pseudomonadota bacterium]
MKFRFAAATAAFAALSFSTMSGADDKLKYEDLIHCAATNLVFSSVLGLNDGETKNKDQIETYNNQAAALMAIAAVSSKKESAAVQADTMTESKAIINVLTDGEKGKDFVNTEMPKCNTLGQAAVEVVNETKASK